MSWKYNLTEMTHTRNVRENHFREVVLPSHVLVETVLASYDGVSIEVRSLVREDIYRAKLHFSFFYVQCITDVRSLVREDI